ncbi:MAG: hypothetical protein AAGJ57_09245, partial [Pseudomonadota bacterium]
KLSHQGFTRTTQISRDRLQNHALNDVSSKHYDRYEYLSEKRHALELWEAKLLRLEDSGANVVSLW